ncbi:MAG: LamG domain-containing protein, partial [Victivallaceae bacterium]
WFFNKYPGKSEILNLPTNKTGGVEWSGMRRGNRCMFIFSNYTANSVTVDLPAAIENLPATSPSIAAAGAEGAGSSLLVDYVVGPKSYWKLDEASGNVLDKMEAGNTGTVSGATRVTGKSGNALSFDGNASVSFGDVLDMGTGDRSISLWFKTTTNDGNYRALLSKGYSATSNQHTISLLNGKIYCIMQVSGTYRIVNTGVTVNDGNWHHVTLTIQRNDKMKLYLDGTFKAEVNISADATVDAQNGYPLYLGRSNIGEYFNGSIDEVKIYSKALSASEVTSLYNSY